MSHKRVRIVFVWCAMLSSAGCSQPVAHNNKSEVAETAARAIQTPWKQLRDGSFAATYEIGYPEEKTTKRCWRVGRTFDCILVSGDEEEPSGWWADRQQSAQLEATNEDQRDGYTCYGGGKREPGVTIGEVVSAGGTSVDNHYVKMPAHRPWSREQIEATVGAGGEFEYFDCPALDRFLTKRGVAALTQDVRFPKPF